MIRGFKSLHRELGGLYTLASLQVLDSTNRLPLTKHYNEGSRVFDKNEVLRFKTAVQDKRATRGGQ